MAAVGRGGARLDPGGGRRDRPRDRVRIGKRELEELARRAAAHVAAFDLVAGDQPGAGGLASSSDLRRGRGIVMLPEVLRL